jgi:hypothetical protein
MALPPAVRRGGRLSTPTKPPNILKEAIMQNNEPTLREEWLARMFGAGLPVADVVMAVLPNGQKKIVWGDEILEAIIEVDKDGKGVDVLMVDIPVKNAAEAKALQCKYWAACDDADGTC